MRTEHRQIAIVIILMILSMPLAFAGNAFLRARARAQNMRMVLSKATDWPVKDPDCASGLSARGCCL